MACILLIDDDELVLDTLEAMLTEDGYEVVTAQDGEKAMKSITKAVPDLVITDILMPNKEGIETIVHVKQRWPAVPIIAISGGGRTGKLEFLEMAQKFGADCTLHKPFLPRALLEAVEKCLSKSGKK